MARISIKTQCRELSRELHQMARRINSSAVLRCGWLSDASPYPDGTPVAAVAIYNEFGTSKSPARPFVRPAIAEYGDRWLLHLGRGMKRVLSGNSDNVSVMHLLGEEVVSNIKDSIMRVWSPPLSPRTIAARRSKWSNARKGSCQAALYKPLVDTAHMINTTSHRVIERGGE